MGLLSLERVNIGFMQIYAVEDVVTVDSLSLGLHDLTCVSLLTLAVDRVKVEVRFELCCGTFLYNKACQYVGIRDFYDV